LRESDRKVRKLTARLDASLRREDKWQIPVGGWRPVRGSPSVMVKMFSAAAAWPPPPSPTPFPYPLPLPLPPPLHRNSPVPSGRSALLGRAGPAAPPALLARGQCGPLPADRALGVLNRHTFAESPCFSQSTESGAEMGPVGRMQSHGAAAGTQSEFAGSRWDILQDILEDILQKMIQDILQGYPTGCTHHPHRISCKDIS
jgi:hypothetical protein